MQISVVSPSVREGGLDTLAKCLKTQTFEGEVEWLVSTPGFTPTGAIQIGMEPKGEYRYSLNRDWNNMFKEAKGELILSIQDLIWIPADFLERMWNHYEYNPKALIAAVGHQFVDKELVWVDPRTTRFNSFQQVDFIEVEFSACSIPRQAIIDVGGLDPEWDKYYALSEKEMCARIAKLDYQFFIDPSIQYMAQKHPRLNGPEEWDAGYSEGVKFYQECLEEIAKGNRLKVNGI